MVQGLRWKMCPSLGINQFTRCCQWLINRAMPPPSVFLLRKTRMWSVLSSWSCKFWSWLQQCFFSLTHSSFIDHQPSIQGKKGHSAIKAPHLAVCLKTSLLLFHSSQNKEEIQRGCCFPFFLFFGFSILDPNTATSFLTTRFYSLLLAKQNFKIYTWNCYNVVLEKYMIKALTGFGILL